MKKCPNCNELIGDNADVCFNCNYDFISKKVSSKDLFKQRQEQNIAAVKQKENQRIAIARAKAERQLIEEKQKADLHKTYQAASEATTMNKIQINDLYEYDVAVVFDNPTGGVNFQALCSELEKRAREGWRLVNTFTNELGVNAASIAGFGTNATIEETILIFERCVKRFR